MSLTVTACLLQRSASSRRSASKQPAVAGPNPSFDLPMQRREPETRVQSIPSLDEVYRSENLPPITKAEALPRGEQRMLQQMGIDHLPQRLQTVQTRTYRSTKTAHAQKRKHL